MTSGNKVDLNNRRAQRYIDMNAIPAELKTGNLIRATGKSIWLSMLMQQSNPSVGGFFGMSLFRDTTEILFLGKAGGTLGDQFFWKVEGKFPNVTGLSTNSATQQSLLVVRIDWNDDGSRKQISTTNVWSGAVTTTNVPVKPDVAYLWVNSDPDLPTLTPETASASALSIRNLSTTNNFHYSFNRIGFRGESNNSGLLDEFRIGTTYRAVVPTGRNQFDLCAARSDNTAVIQWRTTPGAKLQFRDNLTSPGWSDVPVAPQTSGDRSFITVTNPVGGRFYRLLKPL